MRVLIFGAGGIVGRAVEGAARRRDWEVFGLRRDQLDITRSQEVEEAVAGSKPDLLVNCAAWTAVDACEEDPERAFRINAQSVEAIAAACSRHRVRLIQLSSDYVFDGQAQLPYREEDPTGPLSVYGASKLAGEEAALRAPSSLVVRTSWIFGVGGRNFVDSLASRLREPGEPVPVVADQVGCPTYAPFLAEALLDLGESGAAGRVHYRNREPTSWYGLARAIASRIDVRRQPRSARTEEVPRPARRPAYSVLDVGRFEALAGRTVEAWEEGLDLHLQEIQTRAK